MVFANRAQLAALVATNILGQNTPAIAANEAMYGEFWAQTRRDVRTPRARQPPHGDAADPPPEHQPWRHGPQAAAVSNAVSSNASIAQQAARQPAKRIECGCHPGGGLGAGLTVPLLDRSELCSASARVENTIQHGVTGAWCMFMAASSPLFPHFLAGAPFGVTIGDTTPLGAGLGFGTTLAGAPVRCWWLGGGTLAGMGSASSVGGSRCRPGGLRPLRPRPPTPLIDGQRLDRSS